MITIIHGPMASGKTFHKKAFARHYGCAAIVDGWDPRYHELPSEPGRLVLTNAERAEILRQMQKHGDPIVAFLMIDIATARQAIGVEAFAPDLVERMAR